MRAAQQRTLEQRRALRDQYVREFLAGGADAAADGGAAERRAAFERGEGEPTALARYRRLKQAYEEHEASAGGGAASPGSEAPLRPKKAGVGKGGPGRPRKPLPADILEAIKQLEPSAAEHRRLKLSYKEHITAYLAGDDKERTRYKNYLRLRADELEYRRLKRWLKAGYAGGETTEDEFDDDVTTLQEPSEPAGAEGVTGTHAPPAREMGDKSHDTADRVDIDERSDARDSRFSVVGVAVPRHGISSVNAFLRGSTHGLTGAADRVKAFGNDIGQYAGTLALTSTSQRVYQRSRPSFSGPKSISVPLPH
jgi:hypothetical protein